MEWELHQHGHGAHNIFEDSADPEMAEYLRKKNESLQSQVKKLRADSSSALNTSMNHFVS